MNRATRLAAVLLAAPLLASAAPQDPDLRKAWTALRTRLEASDAGSELGLARRVELLQGFVERFGRDGGEDSPEVLAARCRLATLHLAQLDAGRAAAQCEAILAIAPESDLDARGLAGYVAAQAMILRGDRRRARAGLQRLQADFVGTRWADLATVALQHLDPRAGEVAEIGKPAPEFGPRLDRTGRPRSLRPPLEGPVLLVFVSTEDEQGLALAIRWLKRARRAGLASDRILMFGVGADLGAINELARRHSPPAVLLPSPGGFLDPVLLSYRIRAVPSSVLIGPDGTVLARDLSTTRLEPVLEQLLR